MLIEELKPLPKQIYDKALSLGIEKFYLTLEGGSDEGVLDVDWLGNNEVLNKNASGLRELEKEIEDWFWDNHDYSGAGDGNPYGEDIIIDLKENKVQISEWYTTRVDGEQSITELKIEKKAEEIAS